MSKTCSVLSTTTGTILPSSATVTATGSGSFSGSDGAEHTAAGDAGGGGGAAAVAVTSIGGLNAGTDQAIQAIHLAVSEMLLLPCVHARMLAKLFASQQSQAQRPEQGGGCNDNSQVCW